MKVDLVIIDTVSEKKSELLTGIFRESGADRELWKRTLMEKKGLVASNEITVLQFSLETDNYYTVSNSFCIFM